MIEAIGTNASVNPYGNIRKLNKTSDGRVVYQVFDSDGFENKKLSIPASDTDKFESAYEDIMNTAPEIQKYVMEHSSRKEIKSRKATSFVAVTSGGALGAAIPLAFVKTGSTTKKILATVAGIIVGLSAGFVSSLFLTSPPGSIKFTKAAHTFSKLDIKPYEAD